MMFYVVKAMMFNIVNDSLKMEWFYMTEVKFQPSTKGLSGEMEVPGDKSISHRAIMFGSMATGTTKITNFLQSDDCLHTLEAFRSLGVEIEHQESSITIYGKGIDSFKEPTVPVYFGNSGTAARLMLGLLASLPFYTVIHGDPHLTIRPMDRVIIPLKEMGASIDGRGEGSLLPLGIRGRQLKGIDYILPVKSAQVKSAILIAGLLADGVTKVTEIDTSRDHTERMLTAFGAEVHVDGLEISIQGKQKLTGTNVHVPGDISSAAFFIVAAAIVPNSTLTIKNVGLNETRTGIIDVLQQMGGNITISNEQMIGGEHFGDITVKHSHLRGIEINGKIIPRLIDEIPIIALLATQADGKTVITDAEELRVKETDRIEATVDVLTTLGAKIEPLEDGMIIHGNTNLSGGKVKSYSDHRIAMMGAIASLIAKEEVILDDDSSISVSYPNFLEDLHQLTQS